MVEGAWRWRERGWVGGDGEGRGGVELKPLTHSVTQREADAQIPTVPHSTTCCRFIAGSDSELADAVVLFFIICFFRKYS